MRAILLSLALSAAACGGGGQITNLQLNWSGVSGRPSPHPAVQAALVATPVALSVRDVRPDPSAVGVYEDDGYVVRTSMNVSQFTASKIGDLLRSVGARLTEPPVAGIEIDLNELTVVEGGTFHGTTRIQVTVRHGNDASGWSKMYEGTSRRWGRTHNPENFNEALSNSLAEAVEKMLDDEEFGRALDGALRPGAGGMPAGPGATGGGRGDDDDDDDDDRDDDHDEHD